LISLRWLNAGLDIGGGDSMKIGKTPRVYLSYMVYKHA
jgi:hypothetical protein